jgi:hypothetical protein
MPPKTGHFFFENRFFSQRAGKVVLVQPDSFSRRCLRMDDDKIPLKGKGVPPWIIVSSLAFLLVTAL